MNIPNPADLKKQADARRKAREAELASDLESLRQTLSMPSTTASYQGRHLKKTASPDRSLNSKASPRSTRSTSKPTESDISADTRSTSTTPKKSSTTVSSLLAGKGKNSPALAKESAEQVLSGKSPKSQRSNKATESTKKPFERPDFLTQRPFQNHPGLKAMLESRPNDTRIRREIEKVTQQMQSNKAPRANKENS